MNLIVGTMNNTVFTPSTSGQFGMASPLLISNSGSSVWILTDQMPCDSEGVVQVMDAHKAVASITINTEAAE